MEETLNNKHLTKQEDEFDLLDILKIIFLKRLTILYITSFITIIGMLYSFLLPNIYESKAVLAPVNSSNNLSGALQNVSGLAGLAGIRLPNQGEDNNSSKALKKLNSLSFFQNNIFPNIFLPDLMAIKSWDGKTKSITYDDSIYSKKSNKWVRDYSYPHKQIPSPQESYEKFIDKHLKISEDKDTGFVTLVIKHQSPYVAKDWTELFVNEINAFYRQKDKLEAQKASNYLKKQIAVTNLSEIKEVIAELLQKETQKLTLIEANQSYVYDYIDPPAVMEKKSEPRRSLIFVLSLITGFTLSILIVFSRHSFLSEKNH